MVVLLVGIYSEGSVWLVREVRRVLRVLGVGSKTKFWMDCNRQALYRSSGRLTGANAIGRLQRHIDTSLHIAPSFSTARVKKIRASLRNWITEERARHPKECMWCGKVGHTIDDCYCIGLCRHCSRQGHTGVDCKDPHAMCLEYGDCKVYGTHPNFERRYCAAIDDCVDV